jgi:hypothetical protein
MPKDGFERQEILEPITPDHPAIFIRKKKEKEYFEAEFALELVGVTKDRSNPEATDKRADINKPDTARYRKSLITSLLSNQGLQFIYTGGKDEYGGPCFDWRVVGLSRGLSVEDTTATAKQLFQNLNVTLKAVRNDYSFVPIISGSLNNNETADVWIGTIRPAGIEIAVSDELPVGFRREHVEGEKRGVIVVPHDDKGAADTFDAVAAGAFGCPSNVRVILAVAPFMLSESDLKSVASALKWLKKQEVKQVKFHDFVEEGVEDEELLKRLKHNLELWLKNPTGYRIICNVQSLEPIPGSYLAMLGRDLFNCPFSITMSKRAAQNKERSELDALDLRDCINSASPMPALFPDKTVLLNSGINRVLSLPSVSLKNDGILLGHAASNSSRAEVNFAKADRSRHAYIIGSTGTGKSTLLYNMIRQDIENGEGVCLVDPHGDLHSQILKAIPERRINDVVIVDPCDFKYAVGINFLECTENYKPIQMNFIVNEMIKIFDRLYDLRSTGGPMFEQYMRNALLLVMDSEYPGATLMDIPAIFEDKDYRKFLLDRCYSQIVKSFWLKQAERAGGEAALENMSPYICSKLNQFTTNALLRPIIGQAKSTLNFREAMDTGKIILVNLSKGLLGELDAQLLGMLIIGKIFSSAMGRVTVKPEQRRPLFLYIDEFQNFTTDSIAYLLSEARKFGIHLTLANQNLTQLSAGSGKQNILDSVLGNVGSMIILRLGAMDSGRMAVYTKPELDSQDLQELPDFTAAARILSHNAPTRPFVLKTIPMAETGRSAHAAETIANSRRRYTTLTSDVEKAINDRREKYAEMEEDMLKEKQEGLL